MQHQHPGYGYPPAQGYGYPPQPQPSQYGYDPRYGAPPHAAPQPPPQPAQPAGVPFIGARISLISNMNIRYEGTLYTIDTKASTVALQNVRCFGTEGRSTEHGFLPPSNDIYEFIIFGGKDILDLSVLQPHQEQMPPPMQPQQPEQPVMQPPPQTQPELPPPQEAEQEPQTQQPESLPQAEPAQAPAPRQPRGDNRSQRGGRQNQGAQPGKHTVRILNEEPAARRPAAWNSASSSVSAVSQSAPAAAASQQQSTEENKAEYDFGAANARFEKMTSAPHDDSVPTYDLPAADAGLDTAGFPVVKKAYDKNRSFFDDLSTDKSSSAPRQDRNTRRVDIDTFGSDAQNFCSKHGRGGRRGGGQNRRPQGQGQWRQDAQ